MPSIRHHLRIAEGLMTCARANLETAFTLTIDAHYDSRWPAAIDDANSELAHTTIQVGNILTTIMPPADPLPPKET